GREARPNRVPIAVGAIPLFAVDHPAICCGRDVRRPPNTSKATILTSAEPREWFHLPDSADRPIAAIERLATVKSSLRAREIFERPSTEFQRRLILLANSNSRSVLDRSADALIGAASADLARHGGVDVVIENVRLFDEVQARTRELAQSVEELQALGEVSQAVNSTLDLETVLATIVAKAVQLSNTDAGV